MKILLFCDRPNSPGYIPRVRYLYDYLTNGGHFVTLISETPDENFPKNQFKHTIFFDYYKGKLDWLLKSILNVFCDHKGRRFYNQIDKSYSVKDCDMILVSSTFHSFPITTAGMISKKYHKPLLVDLRDIVEQTPIFSEHIFRHKIPIFNKTLTKYYKNLHIKRRNRVLAMASAVVSVSEWHRKFLLRYNDNVYTIYNGFDENIFFPKRVQTNKFILSYFGQITELQLRYPCIFLDAMQNIKRKRKDIWEDIQIEFFTDHYSRKLMAGVLEKYKIADKVKINNFVFFNNYVEQLNRASILLLFGHNPDLSDYNGIMTTKFFEYVGVNIPILITPDNRDELSFLAKKMNSGLVSSDISAIEQFVIEKYEEWKEYNFTTSYLEEDLRTALSRRVGAEQLAKIIQDIDV